ncbi:MAG: hypothetical protein Q8K75_00900 [Chlamydiales bacterium]|nr:hypothetical protein [Chlamydiales bacterium]
MPNVAAPATGKLFYAEQQNLIAESTALAAKLADPTKPMTVGQGALKGLQDGLKRMEDMKGIADSEIPQVRGGLTGSKYGQWTGMTGTVATALLSFAALGFSIYDLVKVIQKEKKESPEIAQVVVQVATCAAVIIQGAIWKAHSWYAKREAQLRAMSNEAIENSRAIANWNQECHELDELVQGNPSYAAGQAVSMLRLDSAWDKLPADQQALNNLTRIKEQHLLLLEEGNDLRDTFNKMQAAAVTCLGIREQFFQNHPKLNAKNISLQKAYQTIKADIKEAKKNAGDVKAYQRELTRFKKAHADLAVNWLILEAQIGRFADFDVQVRGYRCRKPGILFQPNNQVPPPPMVVVPNPVAPEGERIMIGGSSILDDELSDSQEQTLVRRKKPDGSSSNDQGKVDFVAIDMSGFQTGGDRELEQFGINGSGDGDLEKDE